MQATQIAQENLERHLKHNSYPGRGLVVGRAADDTWVQVYWIMGRSQHSQNRRFVIEGTSVRTEPVDVSLVEDPSLIIYEAMHELPGIYLATNGDQTQTLIDALEGGRTFDEALSTREREPDPPNYTPRISAMLDLRGRPGAVTLSLLKANRANPDLTDRYTFRPAPPPPGVGYCITTYMGDGKPLPSFEGDPLLMPCAGSAEELLAAYWDALDEGNRVSLAVKWIPAGSSSRIVVQNRFED
jgi:hypothetical protein